MRILRIIPLLVVVGCATIINDCDKIAHELALQYIAPLIMEGVKATELSEIEQDNVKDVLAIKLERLLKVYFTQDELIDLHNLFRTEQLANAFAQKARGEELDMEACAYMREKYKSSTALRKFVSVDFMKRIANDVLTESLKDYSK